MKRYEVGQYLEKVLEQYQNKKIDNTEINKILLPLFKNIQNDRYSFFKKSGLLSNLFDDFDVPVVIDESDYHIVLLYPETNSFEDYNDLIEESKKWK